MKHQYKDYLKWIEHKVSELNEASSYAPIASSYYRASLLANEATLERHKESDGGAWGGEGKKYCLDCSKDFPCPSLLDVTNQLDLVMGE